MPVQVISSQERKFTLQSSIFPSDPLDIPLSISQSSSAQTRERFSYSLDGEKGKDCPNICFTGSKTASKCCLENDTF